MYSRFFLLSAQTTHRAFYQHPSSTQIYPSSKLVFHQPPSRKHCKGYCLAPPQLTKNRRRIRLFVLPNKIVGRINWKSLETPSLPNPTIILFRTLASSRNWLNWSAIDFSQSKNDLLQASCQTQTPLDQKPSSANFASLTELIENNLGKAFFSASPFNQLSFQK